MRDRRRLAAVLAAFSVAANAAAAALLLVDNFERRVLDRRQCVIVGGQPFIADGRLVLAGSNRAGTDVQSVGEYGFGSLAMVVRSAHWKPQDQTTDSSFGLEMWEERNGRCHNAVVMTGNGHLAVLRARPDAAGNCQGDPGLQVYRPVSNWDGLRGKAVLRLDFDWTPDAIRLRVQADGAQGEAALESQPFETRQRFRLRLNAAAGERFAVDEISFRPPAMSSSQPSRPGTGVPSSQPRNRQASRQIIWRRRPGGRPPPLRAVVFPGALS